MSSEREWIREHRRDPEVRAWLRDNPPPREWTGTRLQWAYEERPEPSRILPVALATLALFGIVRLMNYWSPIPHYGPPPPQL